MNRPTDVCGILLAGTHSWGESPLDRLCPRPLLPVVGRPLLTYGLAWLASRGVPDAVICGNSETRRFRALVGDGADVGIRAHYHEDEMPRGPAGCILDAAASTSADTFVVTDGSIATDLALEPILERHRETQAAVTVVASRCQTSNGRSHLQLQPTGIYVVSRAALRHIRSDVYQDIKEMWLPRLYALGERVVPYVIDPAEWLQVSGPASYLAVQEWVLDERRCAWSAKGDYRSIGSARVHQSVTLAAGVRLVGACVIGPDCRIEPNVSIIGPTVVGASCVLRRGALLNRSVVWSNCEVGTGAIIDRCVVANENVIRPQAVLRSQVVVPADEWTTPQELYWATRIPPSPPELHVVAVRRRMRSAFFSPVPVFRRRRALMRQN